MTAHPERFVVGLDEQRIADEVVIAAAHVAERMGAELELLHGIQVPHTTSVGLQAGQVAELHHLAVEHAREHLLPRLAELEERAGKPAGHFRERMLVRAGHPAQVLVQRARERHARMCFLGPHVRQGPLDVGGTLRGVFAHAPCAVWFQPVAFREVRRILAPVDLSEGSLAALDRAIELALALSASVEVVHCHVAQVPLVPVPGELPYPIGRGAVAGELAAAARTDLDAGLARVDWRGVEHATRCFEGDPVTVLLERSREADLIVMGTHGHTGLSGVLLGNVTWSTIRRAIVPLVAIPLAGRKFLL